MYYVSSKMGERWGVTDTTDGVEEYYTKQELCEISRKGVSIMGTSLRGSEYIVKLFMPEYSKLLMSKIGTPVVIKFNKYGTEKQCLLTDISDLGVVLYDGTVFRVSWQYLKSKDAEIKMDNNDPVVVKTLIDSLRNIH